MRTSLIAATILVLLLVPAFASAAENDGHVALTVYNDGNAIVREQRTVLIPRGTGEISFEEVAATIDPTTVKFRSLSDPDGTKVIEQNYEYDLVSADKLLQKYIDRQVEVTTEDGTNYGGALVSFDRAQIVIAGGPEGPVRIIARPDNIKNIFCRSLPEGLVTKPTLMWLLSSVAGGMQNIEVAYSASNCGWRADYTALLNEKDTALELSGWVTLTNNTGKTYEDASLKLVAGEVHRIEPERRRGRVMAGLAAAEARAPAFEEKAFAEYHLYTLPRPTTIKDRQIKQIELLTASDVPCEKKFLFEPLRGLRPWWSGPMMDDSFSVGEKGKVQVFINFRNDRKSNLGMPLPAGRVRLFKMDEGDMEFVGEDSIEHTPKDEKVELLMGNAFDITAERKRTDFQRGRGEKWMRESFEIKLRNHKEEAVTVHVREHLYRWVNWKITAASHEYEKLEAQTIEFPVRLKPDEEAVITYTVRYDW
jgi:hypothetical protein